MFIFSIVYVGYCVVISTFLLEIRKWKFSWIKKNVISVAIVGSQIARTDFSHRIKVLGFAQRLEKKTFDGAGQVSNCFAPSKMIELLLQDWIFIFLHANFRSQKNVPLKKK